MKNLFATIGFVTIIIGAYSIGEKRGHEKGINECQKMLKESVKKFTFRGDGEKCESKQSGE